jgi:hypothetical protein
MKIPYKYDVFMGKSSINQGFSSKPSLMTFSAKPQLKPSSLVNLDHLLGKTQFIPSR